jgi:uroporphyrinogen decarboxylase
MNSKERLLTVLSGNIPDCVPVAPDFSNMIPAKMTGKPFWDLYLYNEPTICEAYIDCAKYFGIDILMDGYCPLEFPEEKLNLPEWQNYIVFKSKERIVTQRAYKENGKLIWNDKVDVYYIADPPTMNINPQKINLPLIPLKYEPVELKRKVVYDTEYFSNIKRKVGNSGLVGAWLTTSCVLQNEEDVYSYYDNPDMHDKWAVERVSAVEKRFELIMKMEDKPDFLCVGGSGTLILQTPNVFRQLALPAVKRGIELASKAGIPTHIHSCGPEKELVKIMAEETSLTVIDPLEIPPMGNCNLKELKKLYGDKVVLKGNIHTTDMMLMGSADEVREACKNAIDDAAAGGQFILSTGDQCGRDTPHENIFAMIETARIYGRYLH